MTWRLSENRLTDCGRPNWVLSIDRSRCIVTTFVRRIPALHPYGADAKISRSKIFRRKRSTKPPGADLNVARGGPKGGGQDARNKKQASMWNALVTTADRGQAPSAPVLVPACAKGVFFPAPARLTYSG